MKSENRTLVEITGSATICELEELIVFLKIHVEITSESTVTIDCNNFQIIKSNTIPVNQNYKDLNMMSLGGFISKSDFFKKIGNLKKGLAGFYIYQKNVSDGLVVTDERQMIRCAFYYPSKEYPGTTKL